MNTELLPVVLTDIELLDLGQKLAEKHREARAEEDDQKESKSAMKERLEGIENEISRLAGLIRERREYRNVEVHEMKDFTRGMVDTLRNDTGELVRTRPMTSEDRTVSLFADAAATTPTER